MIKPNVYILRGSDSTRVHELISGFKAELGPADLADLNTSVSNGENLNLEALRADSFAIPFLASRRLVIIEKALVLLGGLKNESREKLLKLLEELPETTALVLLIEDEQVKRRGELYWENARTYSWLLEWMSTQTERAIIMDCALPDETKMPAWIIAKAKEEEGRFRTDAAYMLAGYVGNDTQRARREISKLLTYVNNERDVTTSDVNLLTAQEQEGNIFTLVDALGERNSSKAMEQFRILTERNDVIEIAGMIYRQFRLLLQAREILDEGKGSKQIEQELRVLPFVAEKLTRQAKHFSMSQLIEIFGRLLKIDDDMKSGGMPGVIAFELLIAELTT